MVDVVQKLRQMECENEELMFEKQEFIEKIEDLQSENCKNDDLMNKYNFSKSIQETLEGRILNHEYTIAGLQEQLNSKNLKQNVLIKNQKDELEYLKTELRKKSKTFFRWLLTGIWNGFSNLCGRFRDHFIRQNIYWKLFYIVLIFISLNTLLEKNPTITKMIMRPKIIYLDPWGVGYGEFEDEEPEPTQGYYVSGSKKKK
ncbi:hypothetical protein L5515_015520 [Caenorhabditis briggsae]|uniref:Transmembrane protein n=1 Tax=Caenorhabditis briggsae TaxID=6238 RepID=A0AAE9EEX8_CAEBR|nr:hypothetical protein L5515_015520 [Caenorhabditis briggsae]